MNNFPELKTARLLSDEEMLVLHGGNKDCGKCESGCVTCSTCKSCPSNGKTVVVVKGGGSTGTIGTEF